MAVRTVTPGSFVSPWGRLRIPLSVHRSPLPAWAGAAPGGGGGGCTVRGYQLALAYCKTCIRMVNATCIERHAAKPLIGISAAVQCQARPLPWMRRFVSTMPLRTPAYAAAPDGFLEFALPAHSDVCTQPPCKPHGPRPCALRAGPCTYTNKCMPQQDMGQGATTQMGCHLARLSRLQHTSPAPGRPALVACTPPRPPNPHAGTQTYSDVGVPRRGKQREPP